MTDVDLEWAVTGWVGWPGRLLRRAQTASRRRCFHRTPRCCRRPNATRPRCPAKRSFPARTRRRSPGTLQQPTHVIAVATSCPSPSLRRWIMHPCRGCGQSLFVRRRAMTAAAFSRRFAVFLWSIGWSTGYFTDTGIAQQLDAVDTLTKA